MPSFSITPGRNGSISTSTVDDKRRSTSIPDECLRSIEIDRLPRASRSTRAFC